MMHIDYAREVVAYVEKNQKPEWADESILKKLAAEDEVMLLAESFGDEKISSICKTMRAANDSQYKRVTDKQRYAVASFLLARCETARAALAQAFGVTREVFDAE